MRKVRIIDTRIQNWSASVPTTLPIAFQDFWITGIQLSYFVNKTDSGGNQPYQDWLARSITSIQINDGQRNYVNFNGTPDLRTAYYGLRMRHRGRWRMPDNVAGNYNYLWDIPLIFSPEPQVYDDQPNWYDTRCGIRPSAGLTMQVGFGAAASPGNVCTIQGSGKSYWQVTYYGIIPEAGDTPPDFYPFWNTLNFAPSTTGQGLQVVNQINPGPYYRRIHQMVTIGAQNGSADVRTAGATWASGGAQTLQSISEVGLKTADGRLPIYNKLWQASHESQDEFEVADDNSVAAAFAGANGTTGAATSTTVNNWNAGVFSYDFTRILDGCDPVFGKNTAGLANNWLSTAYTVDVATNCNVGIFNECYQKY